MKTDRNTSVAVGEPGRESSPPGQRLALTPVAAGASVLALLAIPPLWDTYSGIAAALAVLLMFAVVWAGVSLSRNWWSMCHPGLLTALPLGGLGVYFAFQAPHYGFAMDHGYVVSLIVTAAGLASAAGLAIIGLRLLDHVHRTPAKRWTRTSTVAGAAWLGLFCFFWIPGGGWQGYFVDRSVEALVLVIVTTVVLGVWLTPAIIAYKRQSVHAVPILILALLFGWTAVGWVVAFVWAFVSPVAGTAPTVRSIQEEDRRTPAQGHHQQLSDSSALEALARLAELRAAGVLTEDEFDRKKEDLLARI